MVTITRPLRNGYWELSLFWLAVITAAGALGGLIRAPHPGDWLGWLETALLSGMLLAALIVAGRIVARQSRIQVRGSKNEKPLKEWSA